MTTRLTVLLFSLFASHLHAGTIVLVDPDINNGSFERAYTGNAITTQIQNGVPVNIPGWTLVGGGTKCGVLSRPGPDPTTRFDTISTSHISDTDGIGNDGGVSLYADRGALDTFIQATSGNLVGTNGYNTLGEGHTLSLSADINALAPNGGGSSISLMLDFGNGAVVTNTLFADNDDGRSNGGPPFSSAFQTLSLDYTLTAADATNDTLQVIARLETPSATGGNAYIDNIRLGVELPLREPEIRVPDSLFGDLTHLGAAPGAVTNLLTVENIGLVSNLNVTGLALTGPDADAYAVMGTPPFSIAPAAQTNLAVVFQAPTTGGTFFARLEISNNDPSNTVATVDLEAIVTTDPNIDAEIPAPLFGRTVVHALTNTIHRRIFLRNAGVANNLVIDPPVLHGADTGQYTVVSYPATLLPGESGAVVIAFNPDASRLHTANIEIQHNDADAAPITASLDADVLLTAPANLLAFYCFDDPADPLADASGNGHHLTTNTGPNVAWRPDAGYANSGGYDFFGDQLIAPIDINPAVLLQMTWGAWVRTDSLISGLRKVLGHDNGAWDRTLGLDNRAPTVLRYTSFTGNDPVNNSGPVENTPQPVSTNDWTFLAASYDQVAKTVAVFVDLDVSSTNDAIAQVVEPGGFNPGWPTFAIGGIRPDLRNEAWDGAIDNVFVYEGILTSDELIALRNLGKEALVLPSAEISITSIDYHPDGTASLTWLSTPGARYTLRSSDSLIIPFSSWQVENAAIDSQGEMTTYRTISTFVNTRRYFVIEQN